MVSRERLLREIAAARALRDAETRMTRQLQSSIDAAQAALAEEEEALARLRATLATDAFDARAVDFDRRLRAVRREAQERATQLQAGFQQARAEIVAALPRILERVRIEADAAVVLNADQVLAVDPKRDLTDLAIQLYDAEGPRPPPPDVDVESPLLAAPETPEVAPDQGGQ